MTLSGGDESDVPRKWRTLNAHHLYQHQKAAGYLFQAELRERLTERLGVEWTEIHKGSAEIVGVPREVAVMLSKRREQIARELERTGRSGSAREAELAAFSTRSAKREFNLAEQRREWQALAEEHGFGPDELAATLGRARFANSTARRSARRSSSCSQNTASPASARRSAAATSSRRSPRRTAKGRLG